MPFIRKVKRGGIAIPYAQVLKDRQERQEKIESWKKKAWLGFCKEVIRIDPRYRLVPMNEIKEHPQRAHGIMMLVRDSGDDGIFGRLALKRDGVLADVYLTPISPMLGVAIDVTSGYSSGRLQCFPSKAIAYPITKLADEMERQYVREVEMTAEKIKSNWSKSNGTSNDGTVKHSNVDNSIPASSKPD